jgi:hypothetical protein
MTALDLPLDLGDGLVLRTVRQAETEALIAFQADVHRDPGAPEPDEFVAAWARDLLERPHPTFRRDWFLVVEETATGEIVSSLNMIPQTWTYGGAPFPVGRIEMVGTSPAYRRRGLVRLQMEVVHRWGDELGQLAQVIVGIPWYYRQFGYEYAVAYGGRRSVEDDHVEPLPDGDAEPYRLRPATEEDVPFITAAAAHGAKRYAVTCLRDSALWRYELGGRAIGGGLTIVERAGSADDEAEPVGFLAHWPRLARGGIAVIAYELAPIIPWLDVTPSLLRALRERGQEIAAESTERLARVSFWLGEDHPVYRTHPDLTRVEAPPYAWYVRVPALPVFVRHIAPVLEARLARSDVAGFSGELRLGFFRDGLRLVFGGGRLTEVAPWRNEAEYDADALFPPLTFLQALFGRRSLAELEAAFPDCRVQNQRARVLIETLFPRLPSLIWPVM